MADRKVRFAYVGCGFVGQTIHIPNFRSVPDCEFVALAEVRQDLGRKVQQLHGIPKLYRSHEELAADPDIEAVGVSAAYQLQGKIAEDLVRAGKHVFMEKPMAVSVNRARSIVDATRASGAGRLMVGYMKRYDPGNLLLKKHLDHWRSTGECGPILLARNHGFGGNWVYMQDPNVPFITDPAPMPPAPDETPDWLPSAWKGPYIQYLQQWTHNVNLLRFFLGDTTGPRVKTVDLNDDGLTGLLTLEINGTRAVVESAYADFHGWEEHTQIYFKGGWLRTEAPALMHKETPATVEIYRHGRHGEPSRYLKEVAPPGWSYREEAKAFLRCVCTGEPFASSAEDTLHDVTLFENVYRQFVGSRDRRPK